MVSVPIYPESEKLYREFGQSVPGGVKESYSLTAYALNGMRCKYRLAVGGVQNGVRKMGIGSPNFGAAQVQLPVS